MSHSIGPWSLRSGENIPPWQNPLQIQDATGFCIVSLEWSPLHDAAANARLMAAAPDLLAILQRIRDDQTWRTKNTSLFPELLAAIAKATGEGA